MKAAEQGLKTETARTNPQKNEYPEAGVPDSKAIDTELEAAQRAVEAAKNHLKKVEEAARKPLASPRQREADVVKE